MVCLVVQVEQKGVTLDGPLAPVFYQGGQLAQQVRPTNAMFAG